MPEGIGVIQPPAGYEDPDDPSSNEGEVARNNAYYEWLLKQIGGYGVNARPSAIMPRLSGGGGMPGFGGLEALRDSLQRLGNVDMAPTKSGVPDIGEGLRFRNDAEKRAYQEKQYQRAVPDIQRVMDLFQTPFESSDWMRPDKMNQLYKGYTAPQFDPSKAGQEAGGKPTNWDKLGDAGGPLMWYEAFMPRDLQHFLKPLLEFGQKAQPGSNPWNIWNPTPQPPGINW